MASPVPQKEDVERWTVEQVAAWLLQMELADCCEFFLRKGIDGRSLMELTEEGMMLWGRDVSIRNRKKIMKLIKQIENQYLVSTGKSQQNKLPLNMRGGYDQGMDANNGEVAYLANDMDDFDDGSDSDFDDDDVEGEPDPNFDGGNSEQAGYSTDSSSGEGIYLKPNPAPSNQSFPPQPPKRFPDIPSALLGKNHQPHVPPEKRPPMPLPHESGANQVLPTPPSNQRFGGQIGGPKLPPGHTDFPKRPQPSVPSSMPEPPRRPPPIPGSSLPLPSATSSNLHKPYTAAPVPTAPKPSWPPKKSSESSVKNSSQAESTNDGGGIGGRMGFGASNKKNIFLSDLNQRLNMQPVHSTSFPAEDNDGEYEVVENPSGNFLGNDAHRGSPPGPSQAPPPLPQRNRDGSNRGSNLQLPSPGSNVGHSRLLASPSAVSSSISQNRSTQPNKTPLQARTSHSPERLPGVLNRLPPTTGQPALPPAPHLAQNLSNPPLERVLPSVGSSSISQNRLTQPNKIPLHPRNSHSPERLPGAHNRLPPNVGQPKLPPPHLMVQHTSPQNFSNPPLERAPAIPTTSGLQSPGGVPYGVERVPLGEGESIELTPLYRTLMDRPFFHFISRSKSKQLLERAEEGMFLIRPSTRSSDPLTLCLKYSGRTYNINIRQRRDGLYALGSEKSNEVSFHNIEEIVSTYTSEPIKLQRGERVILTTSPAKMDHIYVRMPSPLRNNY